jgi:hypothetical protein
LKCLQVFSTFFREELGRYDLWGTFYLKGNDKIKRMLILIAFPSAGLLLLNFVPRHFRNSLKYSPKFLGNIILNGNSSTKIRVFGNVIQQIPEFSVNTAASVVQIRIGKLCFLFFEEWDYLE